MFENNLTEQVPHVSAIVSSAVASILRGTCPETTYHSRNRKSKGGGSCYYTVFQKHIVSCRVEGMRQFHIQLND